MDEQDAYASIAEFYDLEHDAFVDDVGFYLQYVESAGDPVLELACGSHRGGGVSRHWRRYLKTDARSSS
jgi:hypothetical protein